MLFYPRILLRNHLFIFIIGHFFYLAAWSCDLTIARLKYHGGGDWYSNPTSLPNLIDALKKRTHLNVCGQEKYVEIMDEELFHYPFLYMTGHGNVSWSDLEVERFRHYLIHGGFLWADDNYGMNVSFRREIAKVFPGVSFKELPFSHPLYHAFYNLDGGLPKIHEHDGGPPKGLGLFYKERLVVFYSWNTDIGDGLEDFDVHHDPPEKHEAALQMESTW